MKLKSSRRKFIRNLGGTAVLLSAGPLSGFGSDRKNEERVLSYNQKVSSSDKIRIAGIGMGIMGNQDVDTALKVPGTELVAACDLYSGRLERVKEKYGKDIYTTKDYREILNRKDIDAVIISTSDNWHARIAIDAMNAGKSVYCEKPMVHKLSEGLEVIATHDKTKKIMQVGSQRVSGIIYQKAKELYKSGIIGQLNCIEASFDRQDALGAWEYTMPTDGSPQTVDWDRYIAGTPKTPYDAKKFFWWRNYRDFGTGVSGDLFVHLLSGIHVMTDSKGPEKIFASGQIAYWKDGRDVPDIMVAIMHYPESKEHPAFEVMLRVNFVSGNGDKGLTRFIGSEGVIEMTDNGFNITNSIMSKAPGIGGWDALDTYPKAMQQELLKRYNEKYTKEQQTRPVKAGTKYSAPEGHDEHFEHFKNFFEGVRTGKPVVEDPVFGFRACAPCLACNDSYFQKKIINWDPVNMKVL
ncbi:MAG: Gfo/Idh/MocA family oxidoreductase [Bacteroidales bacterium]|nr:Gfo/Idh/MocA family oxidoreductase [Bacteroidales bacterium]MBK7626867.1 Gfo/Idh/MocA family oxidoreductase [Bacteroidales bacterium]